MPSSAHAHPADEEVLRQLSHSFELRCLPGQWMGLKDAKVVLLYLNPGLTDPFDIDIARQPAHQAWARRARLGEVLLPDATIHSPAFDWWRSRAKQLGPTLDPKQLAFANLVAYKSREFKDRRMLTALPSAQAMLHWAKAELFPEAVERRRVVICMRSPSDWGLTRGWHDGNLFVPETTRGGYMLHGEMREAVVEAVARLS